MLHDDSCNLRATGTGYPADSKGCLLACVSLWENYYAFSLSHTGLRIILIKTLCATVYPVNM